MTSTIRCGQRYDATIAHTRTAALYRRALSLSRSLTPDLHTHRASPVVERDAPPKTLHCTLWRRLTPTLAERQSVGVDAADLSAFAKLIGFLDPRLKSLEAVEWLTLPGLTLRVVQLVEVLGVYTTHLSRTVEVGEALEGDV